MESHVFEQVDEGQPWEDKGDGEWVKREILKSKIDPCGVCRNRVMASCCCA